MRLIWRFFSFIPSPHTIFHKQLFTAQLLIGVNNELLMLTWLFLYARENETHISNFHRLLTATVSFSLQYDVHEFH